MSGVDIKVAPSKAEREVCWNARDRYWGCLDKHGVAAVDRSLCKDLRRVFEESCTNTWVKYFDRRFGYTRFKKITPNEEATDKES